MKKFTNAIISIFFFFSFFVLVHAAPNGCPFGCIGVGSSGQNVKFLQQQLAAAGYKVGNPDGIFGAQTLSALKQFQRDHGIWADGIVGEQTVQAMQNNQKMTDAEQDSIFHSFGEHGPSADEVFESYRQTMLTPDSQSESQTRTPDYVGYVEKYVNFLKEQGLSDEQIRAAFKRDFENELNGPELTKEQIDFIKDNQRAIQEKLDDLLPAQKPDQNGARQGEAPNQGDSREVTGLQPGQTNQPGQGITDTQQSLSQISDEMKGAQQRLTEVLDQLGDKTLTQDQRTSLTTEKNELTKQISDLADQAMGTVKDSNQTASLNPGNNIEISGKGEKTYSDYFDAIMKRITDIPKDVKDAWDQAGRMLSEERFNKQNGTSDQNKPDGNNYGYGNPDESPSKVNSGERLPNDGLGNYPDQGNVTNIATRNMDTPQGNLQTTIPEPKQIDAETMAQLRDMYVTESKLDEAWRKTFEESSYIDPKTGKLDPEKDPNVVAAKQALDQHQEKIANLLDDPRGNNTNSPTDSDVQTFRTAAKDLGINTDKLTDDEIRRLASQINRGNFTPEQEAFADKVMQDCKGDPKCINDKLAEELSKPNTPLSDKSAEAQQGLEAGPSVQYACTTVDGQTWKEEKGNATLVKSLVPGQTGGYLQVPQGTNLPTVGQRETQKDTIKPAQTKKMASKCIKINGKLQPDPKAKIFPTAFTQTDKTNWVSPK